MINKAAGAQLSGQDKGNVQVELLDSTRYAQWDAFVDSRPEATFFHTTGWKTAIESAFGHELHYLLAEIDGIVHGVLPLGHVRSFFFGNALISTPFAVYGGVVADSDSVRHALERAAEELAVRLGVDYLELRNRQAAQPSWPVKELYVTFRKEIDRDPEKNFKEIPRKQRAMVRKGIKANLESNVDQDVDRFFDIYAESVRNLGTPVFPKRYFKTLMDVFGEDSEILTITKDGRAVASVLSFYFRDQVLPYYGGGTTEARHLKANDFMYWELMRRASLRGVRVFDYGRSKREAGSYSFKKNWGFVPEPLAYQYCLVNSDKVPDISPVNPKYRLLVNMWKRLPLSVSKVLGPLVSDSLA
jgi:FemAB-related protein (PEP-CTERM system-associated)